VIGDSLDRHLDDLLGFDDRARGSRYPGTLPGRQPIHTAYVPADRYHHRLVADWGDTALDALDEFGPLPGFTEAVLDAVEPLVHEKLGTEPIEDLRIDFDDGYGSRSDDEEDAHARAAAKEMVAAESDRRAPIGIGVRIKSLQGPTRRRAIRTLDIFLDTVIEAGLIPGRIGESPLPAGFRITLPKVTSVAQVAAMVEVCAALEVEYELADGALRFEIGVESPQIVVGADGSVLLARMIHASRGRCAGMSFGTYGYSAAVGVAPFASPDHPAVDFARSVMQAAAAGTGVPLIDGPLDILPVGSAREVRRAWAMHVRLVRRSLQGGFYQGWDLHAAQLPSRYAATFAFYLAGRGTAVSRLQRYLNQPTSTLDDAANIRALASYLLRGLDCGAFADEALQMPGDESLPPLDRTTLERITERRSA
jgi:hypothetical protein